MRADHLTSHSPLISPGSQPQRRKYQYSSGSSITDPRKRRDDRQRHRHFRERLVGDDRERAQFSTIFDPGNTGQIDQGYIETVRKNYLKIRQKLNSNFTVEYAENSGMCVGQRLYYTDFLKMHFRPYFTNKHREERKVRTLIHETAHLALLVVDRPYYDPKSYSSRYNALTPQGSWVTQIPVFGHLIREIVHNDTLYHPDTYAWLATEISK